MSPPPHASDSFSAYLPLKRRLLGLARHLLYAPLMPRAEEVIDSVMRVLCHRYAAALTGLTVDQLWPFAALTCRYKCLTQNRDWKRRPAVTGCDELLGEVPTDDDPVEQALRNEALTQLLARLTPQEARIVQLHFEGLEVADVANQLGCHIRTVQRARQRFLSLLEDHHDDR